MRKVLVLLMISAFVGCATGDKFARLQKGMVEDKATSIMGEPDWVEKRGEYVVFIYEDRLLEYYPSYARVDFYVITRNGFVVDLGTGKIRSELPPPENKCNARLGTIGVVSALFLPEAEVDTPGGWKENLNGAGQALAYAPVTGLWFLDLAICASAATAGWSDTAAQNRKLAVPDDEVEEMRRIITKAIRELKIQETISVYLSKTVVERTDCRLDLLRGNGPHDPDEEPNYGFLKIDGIDHVLEISVRSVGFKPGRGPNPDIFFFMTVHCRLVRAGDEEEVFSKDLHWLSDKSFKLADYLDNDSRLLQDEIDRSCEEMSERIAGRLNWEH
jgi:hypothetical protein